MVLLHNTTPRDARMPELASWTGETVEPLQNPIKTFYGVCHDPQTSFSPFRASLDVSRDLCALLLGETLREAEH